MNLFVARQPIFDRDRRVVAYELLYRASAENSFGQSDPNSAAIATVESTLNSFGLDALLGHHPGFFNANRSLLLEGHWRVLPADRSVIEVLEFVEPDASIAEVCREVKEAGYRLALDDFVFRPEYESLIPYADYIKIDFLLTRGAERAEMVRRFAPRGITMLAEKVETHEDFSMALDAGYQLFQGYFFCRPEMVSTRNVDPFKGQMAQFIAEVNRPELSFDALEELIVRNVALSIKLLRYLRSAGFGWRHEISTIGQALRVLGEQATRKWASLVALTIIGDQKPRELVTTSLVRAHFCEMLGRSNADPVPHGDYFLAGLLSAIDALLDQPLEQALQQMALTDSVRGALLREPSPLAACLATVVAYDQGDWERVDRLTIAAGLDPRALPPAYTEALSWVRTLQTEI